MSGTWQSTIKNFTSFKNIKRTQKGKWLKPNPNPGRTPATMIQLLKPAASCSSIWLYLVPQGFFVVMSIFNIFRDLPSLHSDSALWPTSSGTQEQKSSKSTLQFDLQGFNSLCLFWQTLFYMGIVPWFQPNQQLAMQVQLPNPTQVSTMPLRLSAKILGPLTLKARECLA